MGDVPMMRRKRAASSPGARVYSAWPNIVIVRAAFRQGRAARLTTRGRAWFLFIFRVTQRLLRIVAPEDAARLASCGKPPAASFRRAFCQPILIHTTASGGV